MQVNRPVGLPAPVANNQRPAAPANPPAPAASKAQLPTTADSHLWSPLRAGIGFVRGAVAKVEHLISPYVAVDAGDKTDRAKDSWAALQGTMNQGAGQLAEYANGVKPSTVWPYGQAIAAALDLTALDGNKDRLAPLAKGLSRFQEGGAYAPGAAGGNRLWDDNAWIGLDLIQAYQQTQDPAYLNKAASLLPFMQQGLSKQGGIYWEENNPRMSRNSCANGPTAEYALRMYMITKQPQYLALAKNVDQVLNGPLRTREGLYMDNIGDDGTIGTAKYSYNQGAALGADVLWYKLTGDKKYLDRAQQTAKASLAYFGQNDRLWKQAPAFNAIYFRNLLALDAVAPDPAYRKALNDYLDRAWKDGRDPKTGLFNQGGIGAYDKGKMSMLDQAGMTQMFAIARMSKEQLASVS